MSSWWTFSNFLRVPRAARGGHTASGTNATIDFYFLNAVGDLVAGAKEKRAEQPIRRLGPNTFAARDTLVIIRYITSAEVTAVREHRWKRVYYVIDDALHDAGVSGDLPAEYRQRLRSFISDGLPRILELEPRILAPSPHIFDAYPGLSAELIDPSLAHARDPDQHLAHHDDHHKPLTLCFLGTRSHGASLELLQNIAEALPSISAGTRLTMFFGEYLPRRMRTLVSIDNRPPLSWLEFKRFVDEQRFHICLAPLMLTPFNKGRSITKILDSANVGAASLYSDRPPFNDAVSDGKDGLLVDDSPQSWISAIAAIANDRAKCRALARGGIQLANARGDRQRLRRFWIEKLELAEIETTSL